MAQTVSLRINFFFIVFLEIKPHFNYIYGFDCIFVLNFDLIVAKTIFSKCLFYLENYFYINVVLNIFSIIIFHLFKISSLLLMT
jgi:hypothetical protein